jgi:hypothetical protein
MRLTAAEQLALGVIDEVIPEPKGGAHENPAETAKNLRIRIAYYLDALAGRDRRVLLEARYARYRRMGEFATATEEGGAKPERGRFAERIRHLLESGRAAIMGRDGVGPLPTATEDQESDIPLREDV